MAIDSTIITTMRAAVENQPENTALRLHLIQLLLDDDQAGEALTHCATILQSEPAHIETLFKAVKAAEMTGDASRAAGYRALHDALTGSKTTEKAIEKLEDLPPAKYETSDEWSDVVSETEAPRRQPLRDALSDFGDDFEDGDDDEFDDGTNDFLMETPDTKLADVAGMEAVKRRLNLAFLAPLKNPEMMKMYGKSLRGGLLLYGAPGCGKTYIARAVAGELGARFISVGLSDVLDMWIGSSEKNIHEVFERARRKAPCVIFFDEIDALGRKRSLTRNNSHGTINQLLAELDGVSQNNDGVFVLAATNHPWDVDTALRRPGRLDRTLLVLPPDERAREGILEFNLRGRPVDASVDLRFIASKTNEFSGADLTHLVESAAENAMEDSILSGKVRSITQNDFKKALKEVKPSTRPWFEVAKNYAQFANEGGTYDELLEYLKTQRLM